MSRLDVRASPRRPPSRRVRFPWRSTRPSWRRCGQPATCPTSPMSSPPARRSSWSSRVPGWRRRSGCPGRQGRQGRREAGRKGASAPPTARGADGRRAGIPEGPGAASRDEDGVRGDRAAPRLRAATGVSRVPALRELGQGAQLSRDTRASPSSTRCSTSRRGRRDATRCSPSDRTSSGNSRCGRATTPTAKKWFYEALRLDPDLRGREAGADPGATWNGGRAAPPGEPAASPRKHAQTERRLRSRRERAGTQPPPAPAPSTAPSSGGERGSWPGGAARDGAALAIFAVARTLGAQRAGRTARLPPARALRRRDAEPVDPEPQRRAGAARRRRRPTKPSEGDDRARHLDEERTPTWGRCCCRPRRRASDLRRRAPRQDRRNARRSVSAVAAHVVQIGSSGTADPIELPCGGEVQLQ